MLLRRENFKRLALDIPDFVDVEDDLRLEIAHLRLMRLKQKHRRRRIAVIGLRLVAHSLRDDARLLGVGCRRRMIDIVGIFQRMREHEARVEFAINVDQPLHMRVGEAQRIIAGIEKFDLGAERCCGALRFVLAAGLDLFQRHARLLPGELGFPALAEGQADDLHAVSLSGVKRDGAAGAPDEISRMR